MSLMYNPANETPMNRAQLMQLPTPQARGRFHHPLGFGEYAETVTNQLERNGLEVVKEEYAVQKDGDRFFGLIEVNSPELDGRNIYDQASHTWMVGVRGSHDQSIPRGLTVGSQVLVCSNLCFHGDLGTVNTKQTTNIESRLPVLVDRAVRALPQRIEHQEEIFDGLRRAEFKPRWGDAALVEIYRRNGLTAAQLGTAVNEWHNPSHEEHAADGYTAWRLLNATTEAVKPTGTTVNMDTVRNRTQIASSFIEEIAGLAA